MSRTKLRCDRSGRSRAAARAHRGYPLLRPHLHHRRRPRPALARPARPARARECSTFAAQPSTRAALGQRDLVRFRRATSDHESERRRKQTSPSKPVVMAHPYRPSVSPIRIAHPYRPSVSPIRIAHPYRPSVSPIRIAHPYRPSVSPIRVQLPCRICAGILTGFRVPSAKLCHQRDRACSARPLESVADARRSVTGSKAEGRKSSGFRAEVPELAERVGVVPAQITGGERLYGRYRCRDVQTDRLQLIGRQSRQLRLHTFERRVHQPGRASRPNNPPSATRPRACPPATQPRLGEGELARQEPKFRFSKASLPHQEPENRFGKASLPAKSQVCARPTAT